MTEKQFKEAKRIKNDIQNLKSFKDALNNTDNNEFNFKFNYDGDTLNSYTYQSYNSISRRLSVDMKNLLINWDENSIKTLEKEFEHL